MAKITTTKTHNSGIALGGIGSGTVEILPDGEFHYWQIANVDRITKVSWENKVDDGEKHTGALSFYVRSEDENGDVIVRKLGMKTDADDFTYRMFGWNKPVERIDFDGRFPVCDIDYIDSGLPCNVSLKAVAPFVPHNSDIAATPGFYLDFTLENPTENDLSVSLLGTLAPSFADKESGRVNSVHATENGVCVFSDSEKETGAPNCGNFAFSVNGDAEKSYITADFTSYIKEYIAYSSDFGVTQESVLFAFRENGKLSDSTSGTKPSEIPENFDDLSDEVIDALCSEYEKYPFAVSLIERIRHITPSFPANREEKNELLKYLHRQLGRMTGEFGASALCGKVKLGAGEKKNIRFVFSWYFPNHVAKDGKKLGHYYENLFADALEANKFLTSNTDIFDRATKLSDVLFDTDMPSVYPESWSSHLSTIIKSSWYLKDGKFGLWEGLGYCGFHTTDITYHASFGLLSLFPDLQKKQMKMGAEFQREDGRVHHCFAPDLEHVDDGFDRVDMNMQFVLMVLRDYLFTGDREYISGLWNNVERAMDSIETLDKNGDGLPDYDTKRNTYDAWNFSGTPTYISVLWLAALKAAVRIAEIMNDSNRAEKWAVILEKGKKSLDEKLWNGEYYNLWCNDTQTDESLMTDQLDGEWFIRMIGLGGNIPDERVRDVMKFIFDKNFDRESGLKNSSCPAGRKTSIHTYKNCQAEAMWTGIGYAFAAMALSVGLRDIADTEVASIHENQMRFGAFWDHWECGHHYTRPMSSFSTINAALGLYVNREEKTVKLRPIDKNITLPLCLCDAIATVNFSDDTCTVKCIEGNLNDWNFVSPENIKLVKI
ncbi:MAG: hypothetical protein IKM66_09880 [Clostridia bacterium]|nr:hypothetical protein [Clostridia bacterium]